MQSAAALEHVEKCQLISNEANSPYMHALEVAMRFNVCLWQNTWLLGKVERRG